MHQRIVLHTYEIQIWVSIKWNSSSDVQQECNEDYIYLKHCSYCMTFKPKVFILYLNIKKVLCIYHNTFKNHYQLELEGNNNETVSDMENFLFLISKINGILYEIIPITSLKEELKEWEIYTYIYVHQFSLLKIKVIKWNRTTHTCILTMMHKSKMLDLRLSDQKVYDTLDNYVTF